MCYMLIMCRTVSGHCFSVRLRTQRRRQNVNAEPRWFRTTGMIERHRNNGHQVATDPLSEIHRVTVDSERRPIERDSESAPRPNRSSHLNWELLAIWGFVVFSFAALPFCLYLILAKCFGDWPF